MKIEYRGWDELNNKMITPLDGIDLVNQMAIDASKGWENAGKNCFGVKFMQFTGAFDKNKKKIFAGDFLRQNGILYEIRACVGGFECQIWQELKRGGAIEGGCYLFLSLNDHYCEIVGNIYENIKLINP